MLVETTDADFAWMLGETARPGEKLVLPPGGVDEPAHLAVLRGVAAGLRARERALWMVVDGREVVGLCSYKHPPSPDGVVEIGYEIAASRRRRGHATRAVAAIIAASQADPTVRVLVAETNVWNVASQRVLEKNGFARAGTRFDPADGELIVWRAVVKPAGRGLS